MASAAPLKARLLPKAVPIAWPNVIKQRAEAMLALKKSPIPGSGFGFHGAPLSPPALPALA
ncbi:uncharacterized protein POS17_0603 [Pseudomonas sp. Os17]|nr:uncharacterized protein POS17_0603 [Pseudomonas sp. Os17]